MKALKLIIVLAIFLALTACKNNYPDNASLTKKSEFYQLKIYTFDTDEQVSITDTYLKDAFLPGLKKLGIKNVGVFKPRPSATDSIKKIYVLMPFSSMQQLLTLDDKLSKNEVYMAAANNYLSAPYTKPAYQRIQAIVLKAFTDMPQMLATTIQGQRKDRIYELRSYESPSETYYKNKLEMFNEGGEVKLFKKLNFHAVFFGEVVAGPKTPNIMYLTTFTNLESRDAHWKSFGSSPEWKHLTSIGKYDNNISHADILFLYPTDYSDY